jgi:hypothetical protein
MNPKSPIDEFFRRKLSNYEVPPSDSLWENIQLARSKKSKPLAKVWATWLISSALILTFVFISKELFIENKTAENIKTEASSTNQNLETTKNQPEPYTKSKESILTATIVEKQYSNLQIPIARSTGILNESLFPQGIALPVASEETTNKKSEEFPFTSFSTISTIDPTLPHELSLYSEYLPVPFKKKLWFAKIDFLFSQDYIHNALNAKTSQFETYASFRKENENLKVSNSFMLRMGISNIKGWGIRSGIQYIRMKQSLALQTPDVSNNTTTKNTFETIDIPLILTKEHSFGKLRVGLSLGTYLNMTFNQKGSFYSPTGTLIEFTSSKPGSYPAFKNRLGASVYSGLSFSFPIGNSLEFMAEPYLRTKIPSISADDYVLDQKIWYGGIFIGFRKQIGKGFYLP